MLPKASNPAPVVTAAGLGFVNGRQAIDISEITVPVVSLQAAFIARRICVSPALLPIVAALAFGETRA